MKGRGIGKFRKGEAVTSLDQIRVGDLLVDYSKQFDALNLIKVVRVNDEPGRRTFYWRYADGDNGGRVFGSDPDFVQGGMWESDFSDPESELTICKCVLHRAVPPGALAPPADIGSYDELLCHFGVEHYAGLRRLLARKLGRTTELILELGAVGGIKREPKSGERVVGFTVAVDTGSDVEDNYFKFPLSEEALSLGLAELEDPDQARAEGEEFTLLMGCVTFEAQSAQK